jgi:hypothetical protein
MAAGLPAHRGGALLRLLCAHATLVGAARAGRPCDIYGAAGTPCAAAHSVVRALFAAYGGRLYQLQRAGDNKTVDVKPLAPGGVANAAAHDRFCDEPHPEPPPPPTPYPPPFGPWGPGYPARADCVVSQIYDQTGHGNHLLVSTPAINNPAYNNPVNATRHPIKVGGHKAYGAYFETGARSMHTAVGGRPRRTVCRAQTRIPCLSACWHHAVHRHGLPRPEHDKSAAWQRARDDLHGDERHAPEHGLLLREPRRPRSPRSPCPPAAPPSS